MTVASWWSHVALSGSSVSCWLVRRKNGATLSLRGSTAPDRTKSGEVDFSDQNVSRSRGAPSHLFPGFVGTSLRPSECRAKRPCSTPWTGSGRCHGQPPNSVRW